MRARVTYRGWSYKTVIVEGITTESNDEIVDAAIVAAHETRARLFGWHVERIDPLDPSAVVVYLHVD